MVKGSIHEEEAVAVEGFRGGALDMLMGREDELAFRGLKGRLWRLIGWRDGERTVR